MRPSAIRVSNSDRYGFAPSMAWKIGESTKNTLSYVYQNDDNIADRGIPVTFFLPTLGPEADQAYEDLLRWLVDECGAEVEHLPAPPEGTSTSAVKR